MIVIETLISIKSVDGKFYFIDYADPIFHPSKKKMEKAYTQWRDDIMFFRGRTPNVEEYEEQIKGIRDILKFTDDRLEMDRFFQKGPDDTDFSDAYQKRMKPCLEPIDIKEMKCLFSAWQWLLRQRAEDCPELRIAEEKETEESTGSLETMDGEDEELLEILKEIKIGVNSRIIMLDKVECPDRFFYAAIMYMYQEEKKPWAYNANILAEHIVSILPETRDLSLKEQKKKAKTIYRRVIRAIGEQMGHLSPKDLTTDNVTKKAGLDKENASKIIEKFEKANIAVRGCRDAIRQKKQGDSIGDSEVTADDTK